MAGRLDVPGGATPVIAPARKHTSVVSGGERLGISKLTPADSRGPWSRPVLPPLRGRRMVLLAVADTGRSGVGAAALQGAADRCRGCRFRRRPGRWSELLEAQLRAGRWSCRADI